MIETLTDKRSTNIQKVIYDPEHQALTLTFKSGGAYRYHNVTPLLHQKFLCSPSLGKAFNEMFYGRPKEHPAIKLEPTSGH